MTATNTIVAGNTSGAGAANDVTGTVTLTFSLLGVSTGAGIINNGGNLIGTADGPIDPLLGPLADNGGPTMTHALLAGSPAIDMGSAGSGFDQRGVPFTRVYDGDGDGVTRSDIGAFELQPLPPAFFGDYNGDGAVDAGDYVVWRKMLGGNVTPYTGADGNGDGIVDQADNGVWRAHFGQTLPPLGMGSAANIVTPSAEPVSPTGGVSSAETTSLSLHRSDPNQAVELRGASEEQRARTKNEPVRVELVTPPAPHLAHYRPAIRSSLRATVEAAANRRDDALLAWLEKPESKQKVEDLNEAGKWENDEANSAGDLHFDSVDRVFALLASG